MVGQEFLMLFFSAKSISFQKINFTSHVFKTSLFEIAQNSFSKAQKKSYGGSKALKISRFVAAYGASVNLIPFKLPSPVSALTATKQKMVTLVIKKTSSSDTTLGSSGSFYYTTQKESAAHSLELRN